MVKYISITNKIRIVEAKVCGLTVYRVYYLKSMLTEVLSKELANTKAALYREQLTNIRG